jgi:hypothetical protein
MVYILIATHIIAFVAGALVFRNNATAANKVIATAQTDVTNVTTAAKGVESVVSSAASTVASDVKKA